MGRIWGYIRVSSKDQNEDRQVDEILPLVTNKAHLIIEKQRGKDFNRPQYQWLKQLMEKGDTLVIKSLDRLGRNYEQIKDEWREITKQGINIKVIDNPLLDTSKYAENDLMSQFLSNIVLEVLSFVAENERKTIKQRQAEGIASAKAKGKHLGRPKFELPENWNEIMRKWRAGEIETKTAIQMTGMKRSTFYKFANK